MSLSLCSSLSSEQKLHSSLEEVMSYIESQLIKNILGRQIKVFTGINWDYLLLPSVSHYLFEPIDIKENLAPKGQINRPGTIYPKRYICVHDTGDHSYGAYQWSEVVRTAKIGKRDYTSSFQYVVGNDGWYHNIPDDELAYHAGDGHYEESLFEMFPSSVFADEDKYNKKYKPNIGISLDGFYTLDGEVSKIKAPTNSTNNDKILFTQDINDLGIYIEIVKEEEKNKDNGKNLFQYYIGKTWYSPTYRKISNYGGNFNSIGIESCVNKDTDVHYTWQKTAKLVAKLMDENNFGIDAVVQHHYFSGKNCPQTIRTASKWEYFKDLVKAEYQMLQYQKDGYSFEFKTLKEKYVNEVGRVINRPSSIPLDVGYIIKVTDKSGESIEKTFYSTIQPEKKLAFFG